MFAVSDGNTIDRVPVVGVASSICVDDSGVLSISSKVASFVCGVIDSEHSTVNDTSSFGLAMLLEVNGVRFVVEDEYASNCRDLADNLTKNIEKSLKMFKERDYTCCIYQFVNNRLNAEKLLFAFFA